MRVICCGCWRVRLKTGPAGYSLIEVLVSLFLVYLIAGMLVNAVMAGSMGLNSSQRQTMIWAYGSSLLEEMKAHPERFIISGETNFINSREAIFHTLPPEGMTAEVVVQPVESVPGVYRVTVRIFAVQGESAWEEFLLGFIRLDPEVL